jgi:hypothetical protein
MRLKYLKSAAGHSLISMVMLVSLVALAGVVSIGSFRNQTLNKYCQVSRGVEISGNKNLQANEITNAVNNTVWNPTTGSCDLPTAIQQCAPEECELYFGGQDDGCCS